MTVNKFCPVAQGVYYNNKFHAESQLFFPFFAKFFLLCAQYLHFVIIISYKYKMLFSRAFFLSARTIFRFWLLSRSSSYRPPSIQIHSKQYNADYNKAAIDHFPHLRFTLLYAINQPDNPQDICEKHQSASPGQRCEDEHRIYKGPAAFGAHKFF